MGFSFEEFFDQASSKVEEALNDAVKVGAPAIKASVEQYAIDLLTKSNKESQAQLNVAVKEVMAKEPAPGTLSAAFSATVQNTVFQNYGIYIALGCIALIVFGVMLKGK